MTTAKHFALFERVAWECVRAWQLDDWDVEIVHEKIEEENLAQCRTQSTGHKAWIVLGTHWGESPITIAELVDTAREEVAHLLLSPISDLGFERFVTQRENVEANERVVKKLKKLLP